MDEILKILERNGRLEPEKIASMVDQPVDVVEKKIKEYEEERVIIKYKALVDWEKAGNELIYAFIEVKVIPERNVGFDAIAKRIYKFPEVHSLYLMSGDYDLCVVVEGKSIKDIAYFVAEKLSPLQGVQSTATHFVLKRYKLDGEVLIGEEEDRRLAVSP
jgi:DNA-binding Lrp family transcriptional regulator